MKLPVMFSRSVDNAHFLARCYRYRLRTEKLQIKTLMKLRLSGASVLDVGANKGIYCYWLTQAVGGTGRVLAVEPQPEMFAGIEQLTRRFGWTNLQALNFCLSDTEGTSILSRERVGDGSASLEQMRHRGEDEKLVVKTIRLDDISHALSNLKYIKCDVEGHELKVFLGGERTIRQHRPIVQFESTVGDDNTFRIFDFFRSLGYQGVMLLGNEYHDYTTLMRKRHYKFGLEGHRDFLFFPPEALATTIPPKLAKQFLLASK
ncbi:FkbM family methyltransferase [uncultured Bradyrhizobium sp.]|jgi:FkbM family methyltransferase|uniref:FkbM family methyltransferase n=1 Tax=uncultured Bradyrhizobium sp. TaxID=199684 RepID=UPI002628BD83|nr:FkbM family methyltransferase [uncultured Bradyrhizobium sp.]